MKFFLSSSLFVVLMLLNNSALMLGNNFRVQTKSFLGNNLNEFSLNKIDCEAKPFYRHRSDGKPGREIMVHFQGARFFGKGTLETECLGIKEFIHLNTKDSINQFPILLPPNCGVKSNCEAKIILRSQGHVLFSKVLVPAKRHWTVYIYPHSHYDIGYTNTQANVLIIHERNLVNGIELAKNTINYPKDARYLWNSEVIWGIERYLKTATPAETDNIINGIKKGYLHFGAGYVNMNTSACDDEELFRFFSYNTNLEKLTRTKHETLVQTDVPGMSWGIVPVAAQLGVKYVFALYNGSDRVGLTTEMNFRPFWWESPDGKSKILFLQPGDYTPGAKAKGYLYWPLMAGQTDPSKLIQIVKTDHPREHFVDNYLNQILPELEKSNYYPYDIFAMSWAMADNTPIDADLPDAVKSWNEEYAYPHLIIASATEIMQAFEKKYGNQFPTLKGDYTEYWTDGLGTAAKQTSMNRSSKERLIQAESLWTMLNPRESAPTSKFDEAWRNVIMGDEHTWCYMDPAKQPIANNILKVKFAFFQKAKEMSKSLIDSALYSVIDEESDTIGVFNTLSWARGGLVSLPLKQSEDFNSVYDIKGLQVLSQRLSTGKLVFLASDIPALGMRKYILKKANAEVSGTFARRNILDNGILHVVVDSITGDISSLKRGGYEYVHSTPECSLNSFRYLYGDDNPDKAIKLKDTKISIKENGPLISTIEIDAKAEGCKSFSSEISLIAEMPYIEITNNLDKEAITKKEGVHFGFSFNISDPSTHVDIPWGVMNLSKDQLQGANRNWITFQRWLDISNNDRGITWCSLDAPVFENGTITANITGSATNSPKWIKKLVPSATIYSWTLNNLWYTNFPLSQEGNLQFRYRILPHNSKYDAGLSNRFGLEQSQPLIVKPIKGNFTFTPFLTIQGNNCIVVSIIKADRLGVVKIRLRSVSNKNELIKLDWHGHNPTSLYIPDFDQKSEVKAITNNEVLVPAMGFVTLDAKWYVK
jgi:alpha-mannosidase